MQAVAEKPRNLPPVSRIGVGGVGAAKAEEHPFDGPLSMMKTMKAEIVELRDFFQREQQRRDSQVDSLKQDVLELRKALAKERSERCSSSEHIGSALAAESSKRDADLKAFIAEVHETMPQKTPLVDFTALRTRVHELEVNLGTESQNRQANITELQGRIEANTAGDNAFAHDMVRQLKEHKKMLHDNSMNDADFANNILPRLQMAGHLLKSAGGGAYDQVAKMADANDPGARHASSATAAATAAAVAAARAAAAGGAAAVGGGGGGGAAALSAPSATLGRAKTAQ